MTSRQRPLGIRAWEFALAGVVAGAVGVATSEILVGLSGGSSLVVAIGALAIDLQPRGAKDLVVAWFGTNDKLVVNLLVVVVALGLAGLAGILARRRFVLAATLLATIGLLAAAASLRLPLAFAPLVTLQAVIAVASGVVTLRLLLGLPVRPRLRVEATDPWAAEASSEGFTPEWSRRRFLIATAGTLAGAAMVGVAGRDLVDAPATGGVVGASRLPAALLPVPPLSSGQSLTVPGVTPLVVGNDPFYRIDTALRVPSVDVSRWTLQVTGMVNHPLTLTYDELLSMPLYEQYVTISCVSNQVGGHLVGNALWTGVRLRDVLDAAGVQPGATQVVGRSYQDFWAGFPTDWALAPGREPLIAVGMNRVPLPPAHGFPARLIVPGLYGYVSATKWLTEISLTTRDAVDGYWVPLGWAKDGPILTQSRIDVPGYGSRIAAGPVQVAGIAWAPDRGIAAVEVRVDDGPWQPARITVPISTATWVQWSFDWTAVTGEHALEVRATDGTGDVQTAEISDPAPSGARGHHRIDVIVA
jgi:DMSO/TMAO reductase YedYZ molybdopterin-dependent catalytic subunit